MIVTTTYLLLRLSVGVPSPYARVRVAGGGGGDGGWCLLQVWWGTSLNSSQLVDHPEDGVGVLGELDKVSAGAQGGGREVVGGSTLPHLLFPRYLIIIYLKH